jgi:hypothetical protein
MIAETSEDASSANATVQALIIPLGAKAFGHSRATDPVVMNRRSNHHSSCWTPTNLKERSSLGKMRETGSCEDCYSVGYTEGVVCEKIYFPFEIDIDIKLPRIS